MSVTFKDLKAEVLHLATKRPDFNYKSQGGPYHEVSGSCSYTSRSLREPNEGVGCIFGQAFMNLGVPREVVERYNHNSIRGLLRRTGHGIVATGTTEADILWAADVQRSQDNGLPWGEAIKFANSETTLLANRKILV